MKKNLLSILILICVFILSTSTIAQVHLLLTEAVVTPTLEEYMEIYNPTGATVDLTNYYLSDDEDYALQPGAFGAGPAPNLFSSDFIVQFPSGAMITAGQVVLIAFDGAGFIAEYGFAADYEMKGTDAGTPDMIPPRPDGQKGTLARNRRRVAASNAIHFRFPLPRQRFSRPARAPVPGALP